MEAGEAREAWLAERRTGIGGSDIAAIVGLHPFRTVHQVWMDKVGLGEDGAADAEAARWGRIMEPIIGSEYARREEVSVVRFDPAFVRDQERPWVVGTPDYRIADAPVGVECKFPGWRQAHRWGFAETDEIPEEALCQAQWYLWLYRGTIKRWDVAALLGQELRIYRIAPQPDLQALLLARAEEFWQGHVLTQRPPAPDASAGTCEMLAAIYPRDVEPIRAATPDEEALAAQVWEARHGRDQTEERLAGLENALRYAIGAAAGIEGPFGRITYKRTKDSPQTAWESVARAIWDEWASFHAGLVQQQILEDSGKSIIFEEIIKEHTTTKPGTRRLLPKWDQEHFGANALNGGEDA